MESGAGLTSAALAGVERDGACVASRGTDATGFAGAGFLGTGFGSGRALSPAGCSGGSGALGGTCDGGELRWLGSLGIVPTSTLLAAQASLAGGAAGRAGVALERADHAPTSSACIANDASSAQGRGSRGVELTVGLSSDILRKRWVPEGLRLRRRCLPGPSAAPTLDLSIRGATVCEFAYIFASLFAAWRPRSRFFDPTPASRVTHVQR
jgi:hypothetical protein